MSTMNKYAPYINQGIPDVLQDHTNAVIKKLNAMNDHTSRLGEAGQAHTLGVAQHYFATGNIVGQKGQVDSVQLRTAQHEYDRKLAKEWETRADIARGLHGDQAHEHLVRTAALDHPGTDHGPFVHNLLQGRPAQASMHQQYASTVTSGSVVASYTLVKEIGRGSGTVVYSAVKHGSHGTLRAAVKIATGPSLSSFQKTHVQTVEFMTKEKRIMASITDEKRIMASLQHSDFVIKALEITQSPVNALITELEPCSLQQFVEFGWCNVSDADAKHVWTPENPTSKSFPEPGWFLEVMRNTPEGHVRASALMRRGVPPLKPLPLAIAKCFGAQIFLACQYLHSQKVAWRDLRFCNVVISPKMEVKIIDFGQAYSFKDYNKGYHHSHELFDLKAFASTLFFLETGMGSFYQTLDLQEMQIAAHHAMLQDPARKRSVETILKVAEPFALGLYKSSTTRQLPNETHFNLPEIDAMMRMHFGLGAGGSPSAVADLQQAARMTLHPYQHLSTWFGAKVMDFNLSGSK